MSDTLTIHKYVPEGYSEPTTAKEALIVERAILAEEDRWIKQSMFSNPHPEVDPTTPYCNAWGVCALGAVGIALLGVGRHVSECTCEACSQGWDVDLREYDQPDDRPERQVYTEAAQALDAATSELFGAEGTLHVVSLNDRDDSTLEQVLSVFDRAIEVAA